LATESRHVGGAARWRIQWSVLGLLLVLFALLLSGVEPLSFTADEPAYIVAGYVFLARGTEALDVMAQRGYTPLLAVLEAALFYVTEPDIPLETLSEWPPNFDPFIHAMEPYLEPVARVKLGARIPTIWLTVLLAALIFRWGKDLWDVRAGLLALVVLTFDPTLLAHGRLATTGVGVMVLGTAAMYAAWHWLQSPSWLWALGAGTFVGLATLAKVSGPLWGVVVGLIMAVALFRARHRRDVKVLWLQALVAGTWSVLVFWMGYGFTWGKIDALPFAVPAPAYWKSALYLVHYRSEVFALGQRQYGRWWWYFPLAFVMKNPLPLSIGCAIGLVALWCKHGAITRFLILLAFPLLYTLLAMSAGMNIGYRHMLPIHPFMYLLIGRLVNRRSGILTRAPRIKHYVFRLVFGVFLLWYIVGTLHVVPHELAYFNELIGGSDNAYRYLSGSNLDWGESAEIFNAYTEEHPKVYIEPPATKLRPEPGRYAVGASYLQGLGIGDPYAYAWFRQWEPRDVFFDNILIYDVPAFTVHWIVQCGVPTPPLDEAALLAGLGDDHFRQTGFDCTQAWLYPDGGMTSGIYVLEHGLMQESRLCLPKLLPCAPTPDDLFIVRHLTKARLSFDQDRKGESPAFVLYESSFAPILPVATVYAVPEESVPETLSAQTLVSEPVILDGPLNYLGSTAYDEGDGLDVETWWQVADGPITQPFSIMAHLLTPQGDVIGQADGLGVWPSMLETGDVFVQRHHFALPQEGDELWLRTGAYWLDTMERWAIGGVDHNGVLLEIVTPMIDR
jgi:hypothetical protein